MSLKLLLSLTALMVMPYSFQGSDPVVQSKQQLKRMDFILFINVRKHSWVRLIKIGDSWSQVPHWERFLALFLSSDLWIVCFQCMLNFSHVNSLRVNRRGMRNWLKIFTNKVVYVELFLLLCGGKSSGLGIYFSLQSFLLIFNLMPFARDYP